MATMAQRYLSNGIEISNSKIHTNERMTLTYKGLLSSAGAERVYAHIGYGENWESEADIEMDRIHDGFSTDIEVKMPGSLNMCFKDSAGNWDNNSGKDYSFKVMSRKATVKSRGL